MKMNFWKVFFKGKKLTSASQHQEVEGSYTITAENEQEAQAEAATRAIWDGVTQVQIIEVKRNTVDIQMPKEYSGYVSYNSVKNDIGDTDGDSFDPIYDEYNYKLEDWETESAISTYTPYTSSVQSTVTQPVDLVVALDTPAQYTPYNTFVKKENISTQQNIPIAYFESYPNGYYPYKPRIRVNLKEEDKVSIRQLVSGD